MPRLYQALKSLPKLFGPAVYLFVLFSFLSLVPVVSAEDMPPAAPGEYIIKFNAEQLAAMQVQYPELQQYSQEEIRQVLQYLIGLKEKSHFKGVNASVSQISSIQDFDLDMLDKFIQEGVIEYIEPNYKVKINSTPDDTYYSSLWGLNNIGQSGGATNVDIDAPEAWNVEDGSSQEIVVGVVDTGVDYTHPDLAANMWHNPREIAGDGIDNDYNGIIDDYYGYNAAADTGDPLDDNDHGSHCAGTIAAVANNSRGVVGVAPHAKIMALKFLDSAGEGYASDAVKVVEYAVQMKLDGVNIRVLSNSWAGGGYSLTLKDSIQYANDNGIIFIAAAGNETINNDLTPQYPANYDVENVVSVAAVDRYGNLAYYSNYGATTVDVAAPGSAILSTVRDGAYDTFSGTSMATPHVSGVAALVFAKHPTFTPKAVKSAILGSVKSLSALQGKTKTGGIVSAYNALQAVTNDAPVVTSIANQTINQGSTKRITVSASDSDGDTLTYSAVVNPVVTEATTLAKSLGFWSNGEYYQNSWGYNEKWIRDSSQKWYFITPDGKIFRFDSITQIPLVATLDSSYYTNIEQLFSVSETSTDPATVSFSGNVLTITPATDYVGTFTVQVSVSDGTLTTTTSFTVTVRVNTAPTITDIQNQTIAKGQRLDVPIYVTDAESDTITLDVSSDCSQLQTYITANTLTIIPDSTLVGQCNVTVSAADSGHTTTDSFVLSIVDDGSASTIDTDKDGVSDSQELIDGTDPNDGGSYLGHFSGNGFVEWNGHIGVTNVLELLNAGYDDQQVIITLYGSTGKLLSRSRVTVKAQKQASININSLSGYVAGSYGTLRIVGNTTIQGRINYNRTNSSGVSEVFYSSPIRNAIYGRSVVSYNTNRLSSSDDETANILSIVNTGAKKKNYVINRYESNGKYSGQQKVAVQGFGRALLTIKGSTEGSGTVEIVPETSGVPYIADITRYAIADGTYRLAMQLIAQAGNGRQQFAIVSTKNQAENWIELVNERTKQATVNYIVRDSAGKLIKKSKISIPARGQRALSVSSFLANDKFGYLSIDSNLIRSVALYSINYYKNSSTGEVATSYVSQAKELQSQTQVGAFNFKLSAQNWLRIANTTASAVTVKVIVKGSSTTAAKTYGIGAHKSIEVALHNSKLFQVSNATTGLVTVESLTPRAIVTELIRMRGAAGNYEYVTPTELK